MYAENSKNLKIINEAVNLILNSFTILFSIKYIVIVPADCGLDTCKIGASNRPTSGSQFWNAILHVN